MSLPLSKCRISGSSNLIPVLNLGEQELTGVFPKTRTDKISSGPLKLVWCPESQLLQLSHSFDQKEMYGDNYGYRSGLNQSMVEHLTTKIHKLESQVLPLCGDCVIDIGSNDATSLKAYSSTLKRIGVDPTGPKFSEYYPDDVILIPEFFPTSALKGVIGRKRVKIITSIAMFYDLEDPIYFSRNIFKILDINGIWHFEQSYMPSMLQSNSYDTICHEHLAYHSLHSVKYILNRADLKILDVRFNSVNGGSFAVTAAPCDSTRTANQFVIDCILESEMQMEFDSLKPFREFERSVNEHREELRSLINAINSEGKKVFGYGASTKGNVLLQYCNFTERDIPFISEINPDKFGTFTPGSRIPIISDKEATKMKPDYYLVLPWHFKDSIVQKEKASGVKLIFPFPEIEIVCV